MTTRTMIDIVVAMSLKRITAAALCGTALAAVLTTTAAADSGHRSRGDLISVTTVSQLDSGQVAGYLTRYGLDSSKVRFGVDAKRIVYRTIDAFGAPTTASALVAVPRNDDRSPRQVTWLHGTNAYRGTAASVADGNDRASTFLFASAGYLTSAPDYLGLGVGPGTHPYADAPATVTASVDALRATRELARRDGQRQTRGCSSPATRRAATPRWPWGRRSNAAPTPGSAWPAWLRSAARCARVVS